MTALDCISEVGFGYYAPFDAAPTTPGGGEAAGYVEAGSGLSFFPVTILPGGSLLIATASRYSRDGTVPSTGTMSGFGATWERIYYEDNADSAGGAFTEVWRAQEASYTLPDRLRYSFSGGSTGDHIWSSVGFTAYTGIDPAGLSDNGASSIRNVLHHGPAVTSTSVSYSQTTPYRDPESLLWTAFWFMSTAPPDSNNTGVNYGSWIGSPYGAIRNSNPPPPQWGWSEIALTYDNTTVSPTSSVPLTMHWWAASLELLADPACSGFVEANPYWGINTTTVIPF